MIGTGTCINTVAIIAGSTAGYFFGKGLRPQIQETLMTTCGIAVLFIGMAGALEGMLSVSDGKISSGASMFVVICLVLGALIGEIINLEGWFERFGAWLKIKTGNAKDQNFIQAFVTASLTVCIGAMAVVGAIEDGINGNWSILATKSVLDLIIIMVMTCTMGKGCGFSAIPVFVFEGAMTFLATLIKPLMTEAAMSNLSTIGSILIFCVGLNLIREKKIRVANLLPALILAVIAAFLPIG